MINFFPLDLKVSLFNENFVYTDIPKKLISSIDIKYINDELIHLLNVAGLIVPSVQAFFKEPGFSGGIHVDVQRGDCARINWVFGGGQSEMCWYKTKNEIDKPIILTEIQESYIRYNQEEVELIEKTKITRPTLVQVAIPHNIINVSIDRYCVSLTLKNKKNNKKPTMQEAIHALAKYSFQDHEIT